MKLVFYCFFFCCISFINVNAQQSIKGVVNNAETGVQLPYVAVYIKNSSFGTYTNANGEYVLNNSKLNDTIVYQLPGYLTKEVINKGDLSVFKSVALTEDVIALGDVIVEAGKKVKFKWKNVLGCNNCSVLKESIFEGSVVKRKITGLNGSFNAIRFCLEAYQERDDVRELVDKETKKEPITITLRAYVSDIKGNVLLHNNTSVTYKLYDMKAKAVAIDLLESVSIPEEGLYVGIEVVSIPNNNKYKKVVAVSVSSDESNTTECVFKTNFKQQENYVLPNYKFTNNLFMELRMRK